MRFLLYLNLLVEADDAPAAKASKEKTKKDKETKPRKEAKEKKEKKENEGRKEKTEKSAKKKPEQNKVFSSCSVLSRVYPVPIAIPDTFESEIPTQKEIPCEEVFSG